ncbi:MAG TPA: AAA family ATPase, partial [Polyangiaceae bacterium]|nr:AAA family ATPase [Polyangiaceae bacterium]
DLYAFGSLCYWVLTKRHAYPARELWLLPSVWADGAPPPPSDFQADIPPELDDLVLRLLSQDPLSRPISAAEVIEQLELIGRLESEETHEVGASYLINPRIVGRDQELEKVRSVIARIKTGSSVTLLVEGATGVGKTRLLSEIGLEAQLQGAAVVRVDAELERGPYAAVRAALQSLLIKVPDLAFEAAGSHAPLLAHLVPELLPRATRADLAPLPRDRGEQRVRMQMALVEWLGAIGRRRPLVIIVDNVQAADESSLALFATLPRLAARDQIGLLLGQRTDSEVSSPRPLKSIRLNCERVTLRQLDHEQTTELVYALFGDVNQAGRLGKWLYERTAGHPNHCLSLASQLIDLKLVTYKNGAWVLPLELLDDAVPVGVQAIFDQQIARLSGAARRLAEDLSVERQRISLEQCLAFSELGQSETFSALSELIAHGLLAAVGNEYRFSHNAQRARLFDRLGAERKRALHRRAGQFLLGLRDQNPLAEIDAGWHLLRAGDELRGAEILADAGQRLVSTIEGLNFAAPALEAALEVFDRANASPWVLLPVLDALTAAGWYVDRKYADKYGERTLRLALKLSGLERAEQLTRVFGDQTAVKLGTLYAALQHGRQKKQIRHKQFMEFRGVFAPLIGTLGCLIGVAANCMDAVGAQRVLGTVRMMSAFEDEHVVRVMYDYARYYTLNTAGRLARAEPIGERVLAWLQTPAATSILTQDGTRALSGGVMAGLAQYAAFRDGKTTLEWADRLDALGLSFYSMIANQARFMYHAQRGEMALARPHRDRLELHAIQGGTTWQSSIIV